MPKFRLERPEDTQAFNGIIYGETGAGKTSLVGSAAECEETSPVLYMDFEGGTRSLHGRDIDVVRPRDWRDIQEVYDFLHDHNTRYRTLAVDSLTELQQKYSLGDIMGSESSSSEFYKHLAQTPVADRGDWLKTRNQMQIVIRAFRDLSFLPDPDRRLTVLMTALERYDEKKRVICPQLSGLLGLECGAYVDVLCRLSVQEHEVPDPDADEDDEDPEMIWQEDRHLLTVQYVDRAGIRYLAKNRGGQLGRQMWNPTMEDIVRAWDKIGEE